DVEPGGRAIRRSEAARDIDASRRAASAERLAPDEVDRCPLESPVPGDVERAVSQADLELAVRERPAAEHPRNGGVPDRGRDRDGDILRARTRPQRDREQNVGGPRPLA